MRPARIFPFQRSQCLLRFVERDHPNLPRSGRHHAHGKGLGIGAITGDADHVIGAQADQRAKALRSLMVGERAERPARLGLQTVLPYCRIGVRGSRHALAINLAQAGRQPSRRPSVAARGCLHHHAGLATHAKTRPRCIIEQHRILARWERLKAAQSLIGRQPEAQVRAA